jgi:hypothetical protein
MTQVEPLYSVLSLKQLKGILKFVREKKQITYKCKPVKITTDFSIETLRARRAWSEVFQALK